jgi:antitoxin component YwqK of YwqJK toxin-antitoxin module
MEEYQIERGSYVNGKKQGIWIEYFTDKKGRWMEMGSYDNGVRYGKWKKINLKKRAILKKENDKKRK